MNRFTLPLIAAAGLALSACASLGPYGAQASPGGQGYAEQRIESNRFRVTYNGVGAPGPVKQVKVAGHIAQNRLQAAGAIHFQAGGELAHHANVLNALPTPLAFFQQVRVPAAAQGLHLVDIFPEINNIGPDFLLEIDPVLL